MPMIVPGSWGPEKLWVSGAIMSKSLKKVGAARATKTTIWTTNIVISAYGEKS